jgi:hypothetical protein
MMTDVEARSTMLLCWTMLNETLIQIKPYLKSFKLNRPNNVASNNVGRCFSLKFESRITVKVTPSQVSLSSVLKLITKARFPYQVVTVVMIESRSFSSAEIQHFRTKNTRSDYNLV